jgi:hypothetical protein
LNKLQTFVDLLAVTSGLVAVLHFFVPNSILDWADHAIQKCLAWLERHRYSEFRKRLRAGLCDQLIMRTASVLMLLNALVSVIFKIAIEAPGTRNLVLYFIYETLVFVFSFFAFYRFGIPLVGWIFAGERNWPTLIKTALGLCAATLAGTAVTIAHFMSSQRQTAQQDLDFLSLLEMAGPHFGYVYTVLFFASVIAIAALAAFIANGVISTVLVFFLYFVVFMWAAWAIISALAFVLNRSLQRKGLAVLLASISALLSAIMRFNAN